MIFFSIFATFACVSNDVMIKVISRITYEENDLIKRFQKPITMSFFIFLGVVLVWIIDRKKYHPKVLIMFIIPSVFFLFSTLLLNSAVVYGKASVCFIIRHSLMLFMPIATNKKIPRGYQLFAISIVFVATILAFLANEGSLWIPFAALASQFLKVGQIYFEKNLLSEVHIIDSQMISGEGIWASLMSLFIVFPLAYIIPGGDNSSLSGGALENVIDGLAVMFSSAKIILGMALLMFTSFLTSSSSLLLTGDKQSIYFVIIDILVSFLTWGILLIIGNDYGELLNLKSIYQIIALLLYSFASLVYNQIIRFKCFRYSEWTLISDQEKPVDDIGLLQDID